MDLKETVTPNKSSLPQVVLSETFVAVSRELTQMLVPISAIHRAGYKLSDVPGQFICQIPDSQRPSMRPLEEQ